MSNFSIYSFFHEHFTAVIKISAILIVAALLSYLIRVFFNKINPKLIKSKRFGDDALAHALYKPLQATVWLSVLLNVLYVISQHLRELLWVKTFKSLGFTIILFWLFIRFIKQIEKKLSKISISQSGRIDKTSIRAISQLLRLISVIIVILILLQTLGIPISGVIAFGGFSGIALGFAAKDMLGNFFGGLMIFLDRPFEIGDWIRSPDKEIEGTVENIGWRLTTIRTFDKRPLFVPNGIFSNISVENAQRMQNRRIKTQISIRYDDVFKLKNILSGIKEMLKNHPEIDQDKESYVNLINLGPSALEIQIYTFTKITKWVPYQEIQEDVLLKILDEIKKHGAELSYPTSTIHIAKDAK